MAQWSIWAGNHTYAFDRDKNGGASRPTFNSLQIIFKHSLQMIFNTVFFQKAYKIKEQILTVFLDIPQKTAKFLYSKCENFLVNISSGLFYL